MYYAFYADDWKGEVSLRGLGAQEYTLRDYVNDLPLGTVTGPDATLSAEFVDHLLIEATPVE